MRGALRLPLAAAAAGVALALVGCSGSPAPGGSASPSPAASSAPATGSPGPSASASATPSGSASPSLATLPAKQCLTGTWALLRFVGASDQTYGTGEGGDVSVRFAGGGYTLSGAGQKPMTITLAGNRGNLVVDGRATGGQSLSGTTATFTSRSATGTGVVELGGQQQRLTMKQVTNVIGLEGKGEVACTARAMTITFPTVRLELGRS